MWWYITQPLPLSHVEQADGSRCNLGSITSNFLCPDAYLILYHSVRVIKLPADRTSNRSIGPAITTAVGGPPAPLNTPTPAQRRVRKRYLHGLHMYKTCVCTHPW